MFFLLLGQCRRRCANVKSILSQLLCKVSTRSKHEMLSQYCFNVGLPSSTLAQQWTILVQRLPSKHDTSSQCLTNVGPPSTTLDRHWSNIGQMCRVCWVVFADVYSHSFVYYRQCTYKMCTMLYRRMLTLVHYCTDVARLFGLVL